MKSRLVKILCPLLILCLLLAGCSCKERGNTDITETILTQFEELTKIPRPTHHEEQISNYLKKWAEDRNLDVVQDETNNIIIEVPATSGYESLPKVALQCHMDMVFAQKDGLKVDPLTTAVKSVNDGTYLKSDGNTSLGADDGIGISMILCIADGMADHGPLRLIITTDEEDTMSGAFNLDKKYITDIEYLINVDSETEGEVCVSTACSDVSDFTKEYKPADMTKEKAYQIELKNLAGGHSGIEIDKNHLNGGMEMGVVLNAIQNKEIDFELKSITGGTAKNAIMSSVSSVICIDNADSEKLNDVINNCRDGLKEKGASTDPDMELLLSEVAPDDNFVLPANEKSSVLTFLKEFKNGIRTMSQYIEGLVECSANLGIIDVKPSGFQALVMSRSSNDDREEEQLNEQKELAKSLDFDITIDHGVDAWEYKPDNKLELLARESHKSLFGTDIKVLAVHAGLECGIFAKYNDRLNMIAIGPTITEVHSIEEKIEISSIEKVWSLLADMLIKIS